MALRMTEAAKRLLAGFLYVLAPSVDKPGKRDRPMFTALWFGTIAGMFSAVPGIYLFGPSWPGWVGIAAMIALGAVVGFIAGWKWEVRAERKGSYWK